MHLRSGKTLVEMVRPRNTSLPQNNAPENEQSSSSKVGTAENTNPIGSNEHVLNPIASTTSMLGITPCFTYRIFYRIYLITYVFYLIVGFVVECESLS